MQQLQRELGLLPMENPYEYVKAIQKDFDGSKIQYSDEYFEVTGIENLTGQVRLISLYLNLILSRLKFTIKMIKPDYFQSICKLITVEEPP